MDLNKDELRRQLRAVDADNTSAMPAWRDALKRIFGGDPTLSTDEKAALLGVPAPGRRQFFKIGGATFIGAAVLAACGDDDDEGSGDGAMDLTLGATAASLEKLAVDTYNTAAESGLVTTAAIGEAAVLFRDHHQAHLDALNGVLTQAGAEPVDEANAAVFSTMIEPALMAAADEAAVVQIAVDLENAAAQTYAFAGGALSMPDLRSTIMTIGAIEARHSTILQMVAQAMPPLAVFPDNRGFFPGDNPLPEEALVTR